jgi:hypothetical protein
MDFSSWRLLLGKKGKEQSKAVLRKMGERPSTAPVRSRDTSIRHPGVSGW